MLFSICLVTETEIRNGIVNVENPDQHCLWMKRNIDDIEVQEASRDLSRYMGKLFRAFSAHLQGPNFGPIPNRKRSLFSQFHVGFPQLRKVKKKIFFSETTTTYEKH